MKTYLNYKCPETAHIKLRKKVVKEMVSSTNLTDRQKEVLVLKCNDDNAFYSDPTLYQIFQQL